MALGMDARIVDALPTAFAKPFFGSAARAMLMETLQSQGVDSFAALAAATIQGSTETTFYVLAVYFGAVGIQKAGHAVSCVLVVAIRVTYWFLDKSLGVLERYLVGRVSCRVLRWAKNTFRSV